ncbi:hypothetical protein LCGC14_2045100, partial [marine sediment metagenome]
AAEARGAGGFVPGGERPVPRPYGVTLKLPEGLGEPPLIEGYTRLYRGESPTNQPGGHNFSSSREWAESFAKTGEPGKGRVLYVDASPEEMRSFTKNPEIWTPDPAAPTSGPIPKGLVDRARPLLTEEGGGLPPARPPGPPEGPTAELPGADPPGRIPVNDTAAREMLAFKEETLLKPGPLTRLPIIRQGIALLSPGTAMGRIVFVAGNAKRAAAAVVDTQLRSRMKPVLSSLKKAWNTNRPRYIGPAKNTHKNTLKDYGDHPEHYANVHPTIEAAAAELNRIDYFRIGLLRSQYGVDLGAYAPRNPRGFYSPTVESKLSFEKGIEAMERGMVEGPYVEPAQSTARRLATGRTKTRVYEGAYDRAKADPTFKAETDIETLFEVHDTTMARLAGWNTFRLGTEGLTRLQVAERLYPKLVAAKAEVSKSLISLRGRLTTAVHKARGLGVAEKKLTSLKARAEKKIDPIYEQIEKLGEDYGPELSHLSGESRALEGQIDALSKAIRSVAGRKAGIDVPALKADVKAAKERLNELRRRYENAGTGRYRLNESTRRYHTPTESEAIDTFLSPDLGKVGTAISDAMDTVRATAFFLDASLITIQGSLAMFFAPLVTLRHADQIVSQVFKGNALMEIAAKEPELVNAFARAQGRAFGFAGAEFFFRPIKFVNERLGGAVEVARYNMWKNDRQLLMKWGHSVNVAEAEAASANSKMVPALN